MAIVTKDSASRKAREFFDKGFSAMDRGNVGYAMDMFIHALEIEPGFLECRKFLRAASLKNFRNNKGGKMTHTMTSLSGMPAMMMARGKLNKKPLDALLAAERLLAKDPLNPSFVFLLCDAAEVLNMPEIAVQSMEILHDDNPGNPQIMERMATVYKANGQMGEVKEIYEKLVQMKPNDQSLIKKFKDASAEATMQQGGWGQSKSFRDVMRDSDGAAEIEQAGKAVKSATDLESMIATTKRKIEQEPGNTNLQRALADLYAKSGLYEDALGILAEAQAASGGGDPQIDRTMSNIKLLQFDGAIKALTEAGDTDAATAKELEKADFVFADAQSRVERYPNDREFKYEFGILLYERDQVDEAIQQFQLAQRNPKRRIDSLYHLALCFRKKGLNDLAREQLTTAVSEIPTMDSLKKSILYELGQIAEAMDEPAEAIRLFKEIYAVDIGYKDVAAKIESSYG